MGSWATSLGVAAAIISRNKFVLFFRLWCLAGFAEFCILRYQTYPQKIVQARMWAQGLTIGLLIVAGALTQTRKKIESQQVCDTTIFFQNFSE
jgi:hypothetical protein